MHDIERKSLYEQYGKKENLKLIQQFREFNRLMMCYRSAIREVTTKLEVLNDELSLEGDRNPIESIQSRIKKPESIAEKLQKMGKELNIESIEENLNDVAGIRVICPFIEDIYKVADMLTRQDDIHTVRVKDYIRHPKGNGYRSYHLIVEVPVFFSDRKKPMRVEVQIRTVGMNFWASLEHQMRYKKDIPNQEEITRELKECADTITLTDERMQSIKKTIEQYDSRD